MSKSTKNLVDEGFRVSLVETAFFDGKFEIPRISAPDEIKIPQGMVPFSLRARSENHQDFVCFYENDVNFREILTNTEEYVEELRQFPGIISPDCSLYIDAPLCVQIADIYLNRAVGYYLQRQGLYVVPNVRWGDERTYKEQYLGERVAFQGVARHSIVSIGTYGQIKKAESKCYFREGLAAMLDTLEPEVVLVYGPMPDLIFDGLRHRSTFVQYPDWTSRKKQHLSTMMNNQDG